MIDVHPIGNGSTVANGWQVSSSLGAICNWGHKIAFLWPTDHSDFKVGIRPRTGDPDWKGDKPCYHPNWKGYLVAYPKGSITPGASSNKLNQLLPTVRFRKSGFYEDFTHVILVGQDGGYSLYGQYTYKSVLYKTEQHVSWRFVGDYFIGHCAYSTPHTLPAHCWTKRSFVANMKTAYAESGYWYYQCAGKTIYSVDDKETFEDVFPTAATVWTSRRQYTISGAPSADVTREELEEALHHSSAAINLILPREPEGLWGDLVDEAVQNAQALDINTIAYARDFVTLKSSVESIIKLLRGKVTPKTFADAWLSFKYGLTLTFKDSVAIGEAISQSMDKKKWGKPYSTCRAMDTRMFTSEKSLISGLTIVERYNLKIYHSIIDDAFLNTCRKLMNWDVFPSLENIWDLIPLTFVLDWFVNFNEVLGRIDTNTYINTVAVRGVIKTKKSTISSIEVSKLGLPESMDWSGCVSYSLYDRRLERTLDLPLYKGLSPRQFHNIAELLAIIVQRFPRVR